MTTYRAAYLERAAALRLRAVAHGLAPWATDDHAAGLRRALEAMPVAPVLAVRVRDSHGGMWLVSRLADDLYQIVHNADGRHCRGGAAEVVNLMEHQ